MHRDSFRRTIRARTSAVHAQLDSATGIFHSGADYAGFMQRTQAFRSAMEQALETSSDSEWQVKPALNEIRLDLADLGVATTPPPRPTLELATRWSRLGAHYVVEGSSLGARLLIRRAADLGFGAQFGARYLSQQAQDKQRWDAFLVELESAPVDVQEEVVRAAEQSFAFALTVYAPEVCG